ncbi:MAG TPA: hypothetical protein PKY34_00850, partial [Ruminococcus sp.]|nr:hypothetical protein [Ruminococcus sp.]
MRFFLRAAVLISGIIITAAWIMGAGKADEVTASAYILMEADTKTIIEGNCPDKRLNSGYLSKLMGVLLVAEDIDSGKYSVNDIL